MKYQNQHVPITQIKKLDKIGIIQLCVYPSWFMLLPPPQRKPLF